MKEQAKYIIGYFFGFTIFLVIIPLGFYALSRLEFFPTNIRLIHSDIIRYLLSILLLACGAYYMIWSNIFLYEKGKGGPAEGLGVAISPKTKKLVTTGPYKYTRNPMVFGAFCLYASLVIFLNSINGLICLLLLVIIAVIYLRLSEEKRLYTDFGDEFLEYRKKVPMIFPFKQGKNNELK